MIYLSKLAKRLALAGPHSSFLLLLALAGACSKAEERDFIGTPSQPVPITSLTVEPKIGSAKPSELIQFKATLRNAKGAVVVAEVDWTATGGTISPTGTFSADVYGHYQVTARLRSNSLIADSARVGVFVNPKDILKLSVTPDGTEVTEGEGVQLEATAELADGSVVVQPALAWSADVGQVDGGGYFVAPETEGTYLVQARAESGVTGMANVVVKPTRRNLQSIELAPAALTLTPGETQQFSAVGVWEDGFTKAVSVAWSSTGGTISGEGLFTAGSEPGNFRVIARYRQGTQADTSYVSITEPEIVGLDVGPIGSSLMVGATQQYTATARLSDGTSKEVGATWEATGGQISVAGLYSATIDGAWKVRAKVAGTTLESETDVNVSAAVATLTKVTITPSSATVPTGTNRQFSVLGTYSDGTTRTPSVTWSATGGTIGTTGVYSAGGVLGNYRVIAAAGGRADTSAITVSSADLLSLSIAPSSVSLAPGATQQFSASGTWSNGSTLAPTVTWTETGGTISAGGLYTAGTTSGTYRVIGLHSAGRADTSLVTIVPPAPTLVSLSLSPSSVSLIPGGTRQFSVSGSWTDGGTSVPSVTYSVTGGTISSGGLYTAGSTTGTFRVIAKQSGGTKADTSSVTISPAAPTLQALTISPATTSLQTGGTRQFSVSATWSDGSTAAPGVTWTETGGTISTGGLYTAPTATGTYKVIVKDAGSSKADTASVTITAPVVVTALTVTPGTKSLSTGATQQFTASATYSNGGTGTPTMSWTATGGTISSSGMYTASTSAGNFRVIGTASGTNVKDTALVTLTSSTPTVTGISMTPSSSSIAPGGTVQFAVTPTWSDGATRAVTPTFTATGGTITSSGLYTAGSVTGTYRVVASCSGCSVKDSSTVTILSSTPNASFPHQPSGYTPFAEIRFQTRFKDIVQSTSSTDGVIKGAWWMYGSNLTLQLDGNAPKSANPVIQFRFPTGLAAGASNTGMFGGWDGSGGEYRAYYESAWFRIPTADFENQLVGAKLWGYWGVGQAGDNQSQFYMVMEGNGSSTAPATNWKIWFGQQNFIFRKMSQNVSLDRKIRAGAWHQYEMTMTLNDIGVANGTFKVWIDGTLLISYSNVEWRNASNPRGFWGRKWHPVWGGQGGAAKSRDDFLHVDHVYMSGIRMN